MNPLRKNRPTATQTTLRVYTFEAIFVFLIALIIGLALIFLVATFMNVKDLPEWLVKPVVILLTLGIFGLAKPVSSVKLLVEMDTIGINFVSPNSWLGFRRKEKFVKWIDLAAWKIVGEHVGHTWSPETLTLVLRSGKRLNFYVASDSDELQAFKNAFLSKIAQFNIQNTHSKTTITEASIFDDGKSTAVFVVILFVSVIGFVFWGRFIREFPKPEDLWAEIGMLAFMFLIGVLVCYKYVKEAFFKQKTEE